MIIFLGIEILAGSEQIVSAQPANGSDAERYREMKGSDMGRF